MGKKEKLQIIKKLIISGALLLTLLLGVYLILRSLGLTDLSREQIQDIVQSKGALAPLVFIGISFLQVTFIPIPGMITILAGTYLFGPFKSFIYSYIGMVIGGMLAFYLGRLIGKPFVNWVAGGKDTADKWIAKLNGKENVVLFFTFLLPFFPDDILCAVAGLFSISGFGFLIMQLITRATSVACTILFMSGQIIPFHGWGLIVLGAIAVLLISAFIICMKYSKKISQIFNRFTDKINGVFNKKNRQKPTEKQ